MLGRKGHIHDDGALKGPCSISSNCVCAAGVAAPGALGPPSTTAVQCFGVIRHNPHARRPLLN